MHLKKKRLINETHFRFRGPTKEPRLEESDREKYIKACLFFFYYISHFIPQEKKERTIRHSSIFSYYTRRKEMKRNIHLLEIHFVLLRSVVDGEKGEVFFVCADGEWEKKSFLLFSPM
jgi:hypothetical protein